MKVSKENVQKIFLAAVFCLGGVYYYVAEMLGPLELKEKAAIGQIADLEGKIKNARAKIAQERAIEASDAHEEQARRALDVMQAKIPTGQPVAWLPTRLGEFFKSQGLAKQTYKCEAPVPDPGLPGFQPSSWTVDFPSASFAVFGKAVAGLENQDGLSQVTKLQIASGASDPESHHAQITFSTFVKSEK